jgi:hypothetical protein
MLDLALMKQIILPSIAGSGRNFLPKFSSQQIAAAAVFTHPMDLTKIRLQLGESKY